MKTLKYVFNMKVLLVFMTMALIMSCSNNDGPPSYSETPGESNLVTPLNNQECEIGEVIDDKAWVTFSWEATENTEKYDLTIINLVTLEINPNFNLTETTIDVLLERGYPYSWKIVTKNSGETKTSSETWKFYLSGEGETNGVPFPATLLSPQSGVTVTPDSGNVTLQWQSSSDADGDSVKYIVYADTIDGKQEPDEAWQELTTTSLTIPVESGKIYYWRVGTGDGVNTAFSPIYTFRTSN